MAEEKPKGESAGKSSLAELLKTAAGKLGPLLVSAVVSVGFVAFAGKAVLWTRFEALQVPGDQVVKAVPQSEAVAVGAAMLLIFGALGGLAALGAYLIDSGGRATAEMSRAVLMIIGVEAAVAIWFTEGKSLDAKIVASEVVLLAVGAVLWATFVADLTTPADVPDLKEGEEEPEPPCGPFYRPTEDECGIRFESGITKKGLVYVAAIALATAVIAYLVAIVLGWDAGWAWVVALGLLGAVLLAAVLEHCRRFWKWHRQTTTEQKKAAADKKKKDQEPSKPDADDAEEEAWDRAAKRLERRADLLARLLERLRAVLGLGTSPAVVVVAELPSDPSQCDAGKDKGGDGEPEADKPPGAKLSGWGIALTVLLAVLIVVASSWILHEWWLAVALGVATLLGAALWRIATLARKRFVWYGLAVFLSVPLFGTVMLMARNADEPQVQPMALIRNTDGPDESIQGIYVTETDKRVYFANVATEGCENEVRPNSGRLLWVPEEEVVAMSVGPLQSVKDAARSALEMAYDLTPAVETGEATISLTKEEKEEAAAGTAQSDTRLENVGPAVRPNFGTGLRIEPELLTPGEEATLRMSKPNEAVEGFGPSRGGHNLRLGGRLLDISKVPSGAAGAEYIKTETGRLVDLGKEGVYIKEDGEDGEFVPAEEAGDGDVEDAEDLYVRLDDPAIVTVDGQPVGEEPSYVKVEDAEGGGHVAPFAPTVTLAAGTFEGRPWDRETVELKELPLRRQAWSRNRIKFHVPDDAKTGVVTVECDQLAGAALLQVKRAAQARIAVRVQPNSKRVKFDSSASLTSTGVRAKGSMSGAKGAKNSAGATVKDPLKRRWKVDGVLVAHGRGIKPQLSPRLAPYTIELIVTDKQGITDTARVDVLRLPAADLEGKPTKAVKKDLEAARRAIEKAVAGEWPKAVELDGYTDRRGKAARNVRASLKKAEQVRKRLLQDDEDAEVGGLDVTVEEFAHGEGCPLHRGATPSNLHVDLLLLREGVFVKPVKGCHAQSQQHAVWHPPSPGGGTG